MDQYGQIGPEKGSYAADVKVVANMIRNGTTVHLAHAHRGSRFDVILAPTDSIVQTADLLNAESPREWASPGTIFVAIIGKGAYTFHHGPWIAPSYLQEKLDLTEPDAEAIGGLLKRLHDEICGRECAHYRTSSEPPITYAEGEAP